MSDPVHTPESERAQTQVAKERTGADAAMPVPEKLGRYIVVRLIGSGGMGAVYLSYDPELDRRVALKVIKGDGDEDRRRATLREAQAMARLSHPNVVTVHDVGEHEGSVYIAMEFIDGTTLRRWLREDVPHWRDVLDTFITAGWALEAAHQRGLIHRDFKPDNIMVTEDGAVRVMDFGLARQQGALVPEPAADGNRPTDALVGEATVGVIAGTPAYMAPEQARGGAVTAAVDQFAFCVSVWESISGQRPFHGGTRQELFSNAAAGRFQRTPSPRKMPGWLRKVLVRGLQPTAATRWPSMTELLLALQRGRRRWRWQLAGGIVLVTASAGGLFIADAQQEERERDAAVAACEAAGASIEQTWDAGSREWLRSGMLATEVPFAQESADTLIPWLDDYAQAWAAGRTEVCVHDDIDRDWTAEQVDRALWCLEDRQLQLEATIVQLANINVSGVRRAVRLASYLDPIDPCLDPERLEQLAAPPAEIRDEIRGVRATLSASDALRHAGRPEDGLGLAMHAVERADALAWPPLQALSRFIAGRCNVEAGRLDESIDLLSSAYFQAVRARSLEVAFRAARSLAFASARRGRSREAEDWVRHADMLFAEKSDPGRLDEAERHYILAGVYGARGAYEEGLRNAERALELRAATLGEHHPITAAAMGLIARLLVEQEKYAEAIPHVERSLAVWKDAVGPEHRRVWQEETQLAFLLTQVGRPREALPYIEHATAQFEGGDAADSKQAERARSVATIVEEALGEDEPAESADLLAEE